MLHPKQFKVISFDCYGTLIDWETGILAALRPLMSVHGIEIDEKDLLERYAAIESRLERGEYLRYRMILEGVVVEIGKQYGFKPSVEEQKVLSHSLPTWLPFSDTKEALRSLKAKYQLAVISNTDDDLLFETTRHLGVEFDYLITAMQARAYKPAAKIFHEAYKRIGLLPDQVLHVAQSLYHDILPAKELGQTTVWINRRHGKRGSGATPDAVAKPDLELIDLRSLAELLA